MDAATVAVVLTFTIPLVAIVGGLFMEWAKMRDKQKAIGAANRELEQTVEELKRANADQARRLENLETIVVSQTWNALHAPEAERPRFAAVARHEVQTPAAEEMNRQRAEQLARRLGG